MPDNNPLLLRNLPTYGCCSHCKLKYCPDLSGHYAPCPVKECVKGREEQEKKNG